MPITCRSMLSLLGIAIVSYAPYLASAHGSGHGPNGHRCVKDDGTLPFGVTSIGNFKNIYNPSEGEDWPWYINDHTFVQNEEDGTWHLFGITHPEPLNPLDEHVFAHATAQKLYGPWKKEPFALELNTTYGETQLWAPHVFHSNGTYYMVYCGGGKSDSAYQINLATSKDLFHWERRPEGPLFTDGVAARDPFVTRIDGQWVMYYCGNSKPEGGKHVVLYRTSDNLMDWSDRKIAFMDPTTGTGGGDTESPYVINKDGHWYLFIGPRPTQEYYSGTDVFVSDDPFHFDIDNRVGHINSHGVEVITDGDAQFVSNCGWGYGGVAIAPLAWPAYEDQLRCPATAQLFMTTV